MSNSEQIIEALKTLDVKNDDQWTADGLPRITGGLAGFSRAAVTSAAPLFTRLNPNLDPKPKEVEVPPPAPPERTSSLRMESTEFGAGEDDDEEDEVFVPPDPTALLAKVAEAEERVAETREQLEAKKRAAEAALAEVAEASKEHDKAIVEAQPFVPPHVQTQNLLMKFLASTQKQPPSQAQIDKVMARKQGYGLKRPQFTPRKDG